MADLSQLIHDAVAHAMERHAKSDPDTIFILHEVLIKMSALSDAVALVQTDITTLQTSANTAIAKIEAIQAPSDAADVTAAVTTLGDAHNAITSIAASLDAANPATPTS